MKYIPRELPINKMAWFKRLDALLGISNLSRCGFTQICMARGTVSWGSKDDAAGEIQLCYGDTENEYFINVSKTARDNMVVCKVIDGFTLFYPSLPKRHWQNQNVINEDVEILFRPILKTNSTMYEWTDKGVSSSGSRVRTKFLWIHN